MAVAVVLLAIGLFLMLRRGVSRPLQDLTRPSRWWHRAT